MADADDKLLLLKSHVVARGLSDDALQEIADAAEIIRLAPGDYMHRAMDPLSSVYLVVHGRLKQSVVDINGSPLMQRYLTRGTQFGAMGSAQVDPIPVEIIAVEPSVALKLDFDSATRFTREHEVFGANLIRLLSNMLGDVLHLNRQKKHATIVTVFHKSNASRCLVPRLIRRLHELGETSNVLSDTDDWNSINNVGFRPLFDQGHLLSRQEIRRQLDAWSDKVRIFVDVDAGLSLTQAALLVEFSEKVIWCVDGSDIESSVHQLRSLEDQVPGWRDKINLVWLLGSKSWVAPKAKELFGLAKRDFKISLEQPVADQGPHLQDGFERLVHQLRGVRVGLALGGGGARGMAHIGVLKALQDHGIVVDMIAGTSAGAMTGIVHAAGFSPDWATNQFAEDLKLGWFFRMLPKGKNLYLLHKYRTNKFGRMLRRYLSDWDLEQLPIPVQSVTVDLVAGEQLVRRTGDAVNCILESINIPVMSKPICRDGRVLVDGGLVNNIPADVLVRNGCNFVIAVSVTAHLKSEFAKNRLDTPTSKMRSPSTLQTMLRSYLVQSVNMNSVGVQPADVVIEPDVTTVEIADFEKTRELAAIGEQAAIEAMPKIKSGLRQLDAQLFPKRSD